jgi:emp24/gp25L/p24 family/GOLD
MRVILFALACYSVFFTLPGFVEYCFFLDGVESQKIWGAYVISGPGDTNVLTRVFDRVKKPKYTSPKETREGKFVIEVGETQTYELCFKALDFEDKIVSFEFSQDTLIAKNQPANQDEFDPLTDDIEALSKSLESVYMNIQFYERREKVHRDITEKTCDNILWSVLIKIVVLCVLSLTQVVVLKGLFNQEKTRV